MTTNDIEQHVMSRTERIKRRQSFMIQLTQDINNDEWHPILTLIDKIDDTLLDKYHNAEREDWDDF